MHKESYVKLPVRPHAEEFEGVAEYLQRLAKVNGFKALQPVLDIIGITLNDAVFSGHEKLRNVITGKAPTSSLKIAKAMKTGVPKRKGNIGASPPARVCCSCLRESDVLSSEWSDPLSVSCSKHNETLLEQCPNCARTILRNKSQYQCKCGQEFKALSAAPSPPWLVRFYELFAPWHVQPSQRSNRLIFLRADLYTAKILNKLLKLGEDGSQRKSSREARIKISDHKLIENICQPNADLSHLFSKLKIHSNFYRNWKKFTAPLCSEFPEVFKVLEKNIQQARHEGRLHGSTILLEAYINTSVSDILNVNRLVYAKVINDMSFHDELRQATNAQPNQSLLSNVTQWVNSFYSLEDVKRLTGLSGHWLHSFCKFYRTEQLGTSSHSIWRFPKEPVIEFIEGLRCCLDLGSQIINDHDGFILLNDYPKNAIILKKHTFDLVINGELPLVRAEGNSNISIGLQDCMFPASAIKKFKPKRFSMVNFSLLIQYPELKACLS